MSRMQSFRAGAVITVGAMFLATTAAAQETGQRTRQKDTTPSATPSATHTDTGERTARGRMGGSPQLSEANLASCLMIENQTEIQLAQIAQQQAHHPEVKQFAQQMIEDHRQMNEKLKQFAGMAARETATPGVDRRPADQGDRTPRTEGATRREDQRRDPNARNESENRRDGQVAREVTPQTPPATGAREAQPDRNRREDRNDAYVARRGVVDLISLKQEVAQKCVESARKEFAGKSDAEFDRCFIGMQVGIHLHALDTNEVLQNHVSGEFKQVLTDAHQTIEQHLQKAKELAKKLESSSTSETGRTGG